MKLEFFFRKYLQRFFKDDVESIKVRNQYLKLFNHAHLMGVQDFFLDDSFFYTVTYTFDFTLRENLKIHSPEIQNSWFVQLLTAVDALHSHNIFHKYIHPGYIVFMNDTLKLKHYEKSSIVSDGYNEKVQVNFSDLCYLCPELNTKNNELTLKYDIWFEKFSLN